MNSKDIPLDTILIDIDKFKADSSLKFSVKVRFLKMLVEIICLSSTGILAIYNKTVAMILEILTVTRENVPNSLEERF
jgi:hypothetical protein